MNYPTFVTLTGLAVEGADQLRNGCERGDWASSRASGPAMPGPVPYAEVLPPPRYRDRHPGPAGPTEKLAEIQMLAALTARRTQ